MDILGKIKIEFRTCPSSPSVHARRSIAEMARQATDYPLEEIRRGRG
jgi:hypothetical protein